MSLIRWWKLQDNAANTTLLDEMGLGNATSASGNTSTLSVEDGPGLAFPRSILLNGTSQNMTFSTVSFAGVFSFAYWGKRLSTNTNDAAFGYASNNEYFGFPADALGVLFNPVGGGSGVGTPTHGATTTNWNHYMIGRAADNTCWLAVNGVLRTSNFFGGTRAGTSNWSLLGKHTSAGAYFHGNLCDMRIYDSNELANAAAIYASVNDLGSDLVAASGPSLGLGVGF